MPLAVVRVPVPWWQRDHDLCLAAWSVLLGLLYTFGAPKPTSMAATVHGPAFYLFSSGLLLGGLLTLAGMVWNSDYERSLEVERAGQITLSGALVVFVVAAAVYAGWSALLAGGLAGAWCYANTRRSIRITRELRAIKKAREIPPVDEESPPADEEMA